MIDVSRFVRVLSARARPAALALALVLTWSSVPVSAATVAIDLNGDRRTDQIQASTDGQAVVLRITIRGQAEPAPLRIASTASFVNLLAGDLDGDGDCDLLVVGPGGAGLAVCINRGDGTFEVDSNTDAYTDGSQVEPPTRPDAPAGRVLPSRRQESPRQAAPSVGSQSLGACASVTREREAEGRSHQAVLARIHTRGPPAL